MEFVAKGVSDTIITNADGKGELLLTRLDDVTNEVQRKLNRKVEIIVSLKVPPKTPEQVAKEEEEEEEIIVEIPPRYKTFTDTIVKGDKILLENILFKTNYSYIHGKSYKDLRELSKFLKSNPQYIFKIQGHVCCVDHGRDGVDLKTGKRNLSVARAKFVYDYLSKNGVSKKRMRYEGFGSRYPLGGDTKEDKRVEILVTYVKKIKPKKK
jgi:outer membrane protein OmpA-like peptidoglycan-associated protein